MLRGIVLSLVGLSLFASAAAANPTVARDADEGGARPVSYAGHKLVRVEIKTAADLELLLSISPDIWDDYPGIRPLEARIPPERMDELEKSGLSYTILSDDLGPALSRHLRRAPSRGDFDDYMTFNEMVTFINNLAATRPDLCEVIDIGNSIEGRDIWVLHITGTDPDPKPAVLYHGLIHAREWITGPVVLYLADHLVNNYDTDASVADLVDRTHLYLAPCVNPDGYVYTWTDERLWRKNRRYNGGGIYGVDLNRNWSVGWGGDGSSGDPGSQTYRGTAPFSEPETTALSNFISDHPNILAYLDYHSYSQLLMWPYGYTAVQPPEPDRSTFYALGGEMQRLIQDVHGEYYRAGPIYSTIYEASGTSVDWGYGDQGVFAFTIELRPTSMLPGFTLPPEEIIPTCEENLPALLYLSQWDLIDLSFRFPDGPPDRITAGSDTLVAVEIVPLLDSADPGSARMFYRYDPSGPFVEVPLTHLDGDSYEVVLPATNCTSSPEFYFTALSSGGRECTSPCGAPDKVYFAKVVGPGPGQVFVQEDFDNDPGWTTEGLWAFGQPTGGGSFDHDPTSGYTGDNVYGYNLFGDYENSLPAAYLTIPALDCSGRHNVELEFRRWLGVDSALDSDEATIEVSNDGLDWTVIWRATHTGDVVSDSSWQSQSFNIFSIADDEPAVHLRWSMGPTSRNRSYPGWNIDDLRLTCTTCQAVKGDYNGDGVVESADFAAFGECLTGPGGGLGPGCAILDFHDDGDVDLDDFAEFQAAFDQS